MEFNCITLLFHGFDLLTDNILEHSGTFWNILERLVTKVMSVTDLQRELKLEPSRTYWKDL